MLYQSHVFLIFATENFLFLLCTFLPSNGRELEPRSILHGACKRTYQVARRYKKEIIVLEVLWKALGGMRAVFIGSNWKNEKEMRNYLNNVHPHAVYNTYMPLLTTRMCEDHLALLLMLLSFIMWHVTIWYTRGIKIVGTIFLKECQGYTTAFFIATLTVGE